MQKKKRERAERIAKEKQELEKEMNYNPFGIINHGSPRQQKKRRQGLYGDVPQEPEQ
jgi:hypothetical protein